MPDFVLVMLLRPFVLLVLSVLVLIPARLAVQKWMPDGRFKRILLWRIPQ